MAEWPALAVRASALTAGTFASDCTLGQVMELFCTLVFLQKSIFKNHVKIGSLEQCVTNEN